MSLAAAAVMCVAACFGQVVLRGHEAPPPGDVIEVTLDGVSVQDERGAAIILGWDRVREVRGVFADQAAAHASLSDQVWRARVRIERGDAYAAEPLLEKPFEMFEGRGGPTAMVIAEGLLRARLRRGAQVAAVRPWIALLHARQSTGPANLHREWATEAGLPDVVDTNTGLVPALPPIWFDWPAVVAFAAAGRERAGEGLKGPAALEALYFHAARFECGWRDEFPAVDRSSWAVAMVADIVRARTGSPGERSRARDGLRAALTAAPEPWLEAWIRVGMGRSLVRESDPESRLLGVAELLTVPARLSQANPYLAGMALAEAAIVLHGLGDARGAAALRAELLDAYPDHPAATWNRIRDWPPTSGGQAGAIDSPDRASAWDSGTQRLAPGRGESGDSLDESMDARASRMPRQSEGDSAFALGGCQCHELQCHFQVP